VGVADIPMDAETQPDPHLEIAHVLFIDIVGYSKRLIDEQSSLVKRLNDLVRQSREFQDADAGGKLIRIPTGDGMALVFFTTPDAPVRCAVELSKADQGDPKIELRMGIHTGPVDRVADVNERTNIAGAGINMAQRVMDCGDAGHILLSKRVADDLAQYGRWKPQLHELGRVEVKHGVGIDLVNFYGDDFGNSALPQKVASLRTSEAAASKRVSSKSKRRRNIIVATVAGVTAVAIALSISAYRMSRQLTQVDVATAAANAIPDKSVAVLAFESIGGASDGAFLASGLQDEIITRLAKIASLKVISRSSVRGFESKPANLAGIAKELAVNAILEGSVQKIGEQLRVNVQLIKASTNTHIWAETYDRQLVDVFSVESEVATQVANALRAALSPEEKARVEKMPTQNAEAYALYRRARDIQVGISDTRDDYDETRRLLEQAVAIEPTFALAHAALGDVLLGLHVDLDRTEDLKTAARSHIDEALRLDPDLGEGHKVLGKYFNSDFDYVAAAREFAIAQKALPNDAELIRITAMMGRRQGHWRQAIPALQRAMSLDPRDLQNIDWLANTYFDLKEWKLAEEAKRRVVDVAVSIKAPPSSVLEAKLAVAYVNFFRTGNLDATKAALKEVPPGFDPEGMVTDFRWSFAMMGRDYTDAQRTIDSYPQPYIQRAGSTRTPKVWYQGCTALAQGDLPHARSLLQTALSFYESELAKAPLSDQVHLDVAAAQAFLGHKEEAIREARLAAELRPEAKDARMGVYCSIAVAQVYAWAGETDDAMALVERLVTTPVGPSVVDLRHNWMWDPLRKDPRFQKLLAGTEPKVIYN